ncbi:MAG: hypothetical protein KatS3mg090_0972 [Patescibacteria group bacterium]|nr:MAG: hypothetical protein KatS3mg090_0972 [Patescibacteria group bacterium]
MYNKELVDPNAVSEIELLHQPTQRENPSDYLERVLGQNVSLRDLQENSQGLEEMKSFFTNAITKNSLQMLEHLDQVYKGSFNPSDFVNTYSDNLENIIMQNPYLRNRYEKLSEDDDKITYKLNLILNPLFRSAIKEIKREITSAENLNHVVEVNELRNIVSSIEHKINLEKAKQEYLKQLRYEYIKKLNINEAKANTLKAIINKFNQTNTPKIKVQGSDPNKILGTFIEALRQNLSQQQITQETYDYYFELTTYITSINAPKIKNENDFNKELNRIYRKLKEGESNLQEKKLELSQKENTVKTLEETINNSLLYAALKTERGILINQFADNRSRESDNYIDNLTARIILSLSLENEINSDENKLSKRNAFIKRYKSLTNLWKKIIAGQKIENIVQDQQLKQEVSYLFKQNPTLYKKVEANILSAILQWKLSFDLEISQYGLIYKLIKGIPNNLATRDEILTVINRIGDPQLIKKVEEFIRSNQNLLKQLGYNKIETTATASKTIGRISKGLFYGGVTLAVIASGFALGKYIFNMFY